MRASPPALSLERELKKIEGEYVERLTMNDEGLHVKHTSTLLYSYTPELLKKDER